MCALLAIRLRMNMHIDIYVTFVSAHLFACGSMRRYVQQASFIRGTTIMVYPFLSLFFPTTRRRWLSLSRECPRHVLRDLRPKVSKLLPHLLMPRRKAQTKMQQKCNPHAHTHTHRLGLRRSSWADSHSGTILLETAHRAVKS